MSMKTTTTTPPLPSEKSEAPVIAAPQVPDAGRKRRWALSLARSYSRRALRRRFEAVYVEGLEETRALARATPLVFAANHTSWWDAFALLALDDALGTDGYVLMDEAHLRRLSFFAPLGALPLARDDALAARRQLLTATRLLDQPGRALWIFPQGEQRPAHLRPLGFRAGVRLLMNQAHCPVVPVAITPIWRNRPEPALFIHLGAPVSPSTEKSAVVRSLEESVAAGLARLDVLAAGDVPLPPALLRGSGRSAEDGIAAWLLARLTQPKPRP